MGKTVQINGFGEKATSKKETVLYGRVTKKKNKEIVTHTGSVYKFPYYDKEPIKSAFGLSGIGTALINTEGRIFDVNNAFCNFIGYSKNELLGYSMLDLGHPNDKQNDSHLLREMQANTLNYYSLEKRYVSKDNKVLWGIHTVSKVSDDNDIADYYLLQVSDITHHKTRNHELNRKNNELEAVRFRQLNKITQLEELNHIIAHNLRGPANNIKLLVDMLLEKFTENGDTYPQLGVQDIANYLKEGSDSMADSLNTLMDIVQASMSKDIPFDDCDVHQITNEILNKLNNTISETGSFVQLDMAVPAIRYPKVFLEGILHNLINNALKHINPERIPDILVRTYMRDGRTAISVKDNGIGIDLVKNGNKLFELKHAFHGNQNSRSTGMYVIKVQVESLGGEIHVSSSEKDGTEFIVIL